MPRKHPKRDARRGGRPRADDRDSLGYSAEQEQQRRANCAAKARYGSEAEARSHAIMHRPGPGTRSQAYRCDVCEGWHLTRG